MKQHLFHRVLLITIVFLFSEYALALTVTQFKQICESSEISCSEHSIVQAYVGGALDLIATLDEETNYLKEITCDDLSMMFDVKNIIEYIQSESHYSKYQDKNAMLLLIRYIEKNDGC